MSEPQEKLEKGIGNKEPETLKPAKVKIVKVQIEPVGAKGNEKVVCTCKHPDREDPIRISTVKVLKKEKVKTSGIWYNEDEDGLIPKTSVLADLLRFVNVDSVKQLEEKELDTLLDDDGYLCLKAY